MIRDDLSTKLIHLTKGDNGDEIFTRFISILKERRLKGGDGMIKGQFKCVCFTETPISKLAYALSEPSKNHMKYAACGLMFDKNKIFSEGGRPVIYQKQDEYDLLSDGLKWRHVTYDIGSKQKVDFTWEREWRVKKDFLYFEPKDVTVIFPNRLWAEAFIESHIKKVQQTLISSNKEDEQIKSIVRNFEWHYIVLEDLGLPIDDQLNKKPSG